MWPFATPINLIRYLVVWRNQASLIRLPPVPSVAISEVIGAAVAERLGAYQAKPWLKALARTTELRVQDQFSDTPWPIEAGEHPCLSWQSHSGARRATMWELTLFGAGADHGFFLEVLLPVLEALSTTNDPRWKSAYSLWGNVALDSIFVAYGQRWEPLVQNGRLDLRMTVCPHSDRRPEQHHQSSAFIPPDHLDHAIRPRQDAGPPR